MVNGGRPITDINHLIHSYSDKRNTLYLIKFVQLIISNIKSAYSLEQIIKMKFIYQDFLVFCAAIAAAAPIDDKSSAITRTTRQTLLESMLQTKS